MKYVIGQEGQAVNASFSLHLVGSSGRLQRFMHQLPTAVLLVNQEGSIVEVNEQLLRVTGYPRDQLINQPIQTVLPFEGSMERLYEELLQREAESESHVEMEWRDKQGRCAKTPAMILVQQADQPLYLIHLFQLAKETDYALSQRIVAKLTHDTSLGLFVLDAQGHIIEASQTACKLLGMEKLKVINKHVDQVFAGIPEQHRLI
jgi:two-component system, sporulation sensor kinase E